MLLLFQCRKCGKFFCRSKHYTASVSNICCVKIITPCNINRQIILMIPCFIFYRNPEYTCRHIFSPFNLIYFILTCVMLKVKFLSYFSRLYPLLGQIRASQKKAYLFPVRRSCRKLCWSSEKPVQMRFHQSPGCST